MKRREKLPERILSPINPVTCLSPNGISTLPSEEISADNVGWKAYGLTSLPAEWVPKFLVISADCFLNVDSEKILSQELESGLVQAGVKSSVLKFRSSGTTETIQFRGRLVSGSCVRDELVPTVKDFIAKLQPTTSGKIHWIVQEHVQPVRQGHLSNERRVSKEKRDWVAEVELKDEAIGYPIPIAVRRWRDGTKISDFALACKSEIEISFCLKRVALWAERLRSRTHFEWIWNGDAVKVVQADVAEFVGGIDPASVIPAEIPLISVNSLSCFREATNEAYDTYAKLRNAKMYRDIGYQMPTFYVLDSPEELSSVLNGEVSEALRRDLRELTRRPLILRTDGTNIPKEKQEMLPRTDELRTVREAEEWLLGPAKLALRNRAYH
jgi:hypothetical protein